ncbi:MAG: bifunctional riboflavin kinase/FAD synthetase [Candidatus Margulisiibacteriota bacterium]|nr:bifunctional riboflavin kinase/FAD synthetase [Candidatus Margulisiibacteriota bacterium]
MRIIRHPKRKNLKGSVVALGTFDGVHRGHRKVVKNAVKYADKLGVASLAITFDPHPQQLIIPKRGLKLLTTLREREELFADLGVDGVVVVKFQKRTQQLSTEAFVKEYLVDKLGVRRVFVGFDYAFGKGRKGNTALLKEYGKKYGFKVSVVSPVSSGKHIIKSRIIRELVVSGKFAKAVTLLGHGYQLSGKVVKGYGRGESLGFQTANLQLDPHKLIPFPGVYAGYALGKKCAIHIGSRPTFGEGNLAVEVHILNFRKNIRGKHLNVLLTKRLRDELQFSDVEKLKRQISRDIKRT